MTPAERIARAQGASIPLTAYTDQELVAELRQVQPFAERVAEIIRYAVRAGGETLEVIEREVSHGHR